MKQVFKDKALTFEQQVDLLEKQGLVIEDRNRALQILSNVSYSRLKAYIVPLMVERYPRKFMEGASFELAYALYGFDRRLRELVFHEMEKIEVSIRTRFGYATSDIDAGYWYLKPEYFRDEKQHYDLMKRISGEVKRCDIDAIERFYEKYSNPLPPCWMALEAVSMGTLSCIYDDLKPGPVKRAIAEYYGVSDTVFSSWLHHLVYIRNNCAHHNRLWNKNLSISAIIPKTPKRYFPPQQRLEPQRVYTTLCIIKFMQDAIKPTNSFADRLKRLLHNFPQVGREQMGFPSDWEESFFWKTGKEKSISPDIR